MKQLQAVWFTSFIFLAASCSMQQKIRRTAFATILEQEALKTAHIGISVFDPASGAFLYNHQADKYFVPASNTKIATCYAAMQYLGDSVPGILYRTEPDALVIAPTGDPTFLHPAFSHQKVFAWLRNTSQPLFLALDSWKDQPWGSGWSWNDFEAPYMAERSAMPIYGNVVRMDSTLNALRIVPSYFSDVRRDGTSDDGYLSSVQRQLSANTFTVSGGAKKNQLIERSFLTDHGNIIFQLLPDTLNRPVQPTNFFDDTTATWDTLYSQATDSVLRPMMHESDNFLAEQSLLMVGRKLMGEMNGARLMDSLLKSDFKELPQRPRWADGSGLSRYNLFTPRDFVWILQQMQQRFGLRRMQDIFPTGNEGTLANYYKKDSGFIYAKTGTLSGVVALSGFVYTHKNRLFIFSILINNHQASATTVRRALEGFVQRLRSRF